MAIKTDGTNFFKTPSRPRLAGLTNGATSRLDRIRSGKAPLKVAAFGSSV